MTVRVNVVVVLELPTVSWRPGRRALERQDDRPRVEAERLRVGQPAGVGRRELELEVRGILVVRCATNEPLATPLHCWMVWEWQFVGSYCQQCCTTRVHESPDVATTPPGSSASVAEPAKLIVSPTRHRVPVGRRRDRRRGRRVGRPLRHRGGDVRVPAEVRVRRPILSSNLVAVCRGGLETRVVEGVGRRSPDLGEVRAARALAALDAVAAARPRRPWRQSR